MEYKKILIQLDSDPHPSSFDAIVALDSGADQILSYGEVNELNVVGLVHGAMFTRGPQALANTAVFIGGSDVPLGERLFKKVRELFFGPLCVSVMLDSNGSNTTAAAAVLSVLRHTDFSATPRVTVLGGTGPVGRRIAQMCAAQGASTKLVSRELGRAQRTVAQLPPTTGKVEPRSVVTKEQLDAVLAETDVLFAAGAAGVEMVPQAVIQRHPTLKFIVDVNAVPPLGIGGIKHDDRGAVRDDKTYYGALGVGALKMKIHQRAIQQLFESNQALLDAAEIFTLGRTLTVGGAAGRGS